MNRRHLFTALFAASLAFALPAGAQSPSGYIELSPPQATDAQDKIEVLEFFSYACIHCSNVHPAAKQWAAKLPADVVFKRIPVVFDPRQEPTARLFYALEATGDLARLDDAVFAAIHVQKLHMMTDKAVLDWVAGQGVDIKKFEAAYRKLKFGDVVLFRSDYSDRYYRPLPEGNRVQLRHLQDELNPQID